MIITFGGQKGGVGKTVLATHIAVMRARAGRDVCLVDADPQLTASDFCAARDEQCKSTDISRINSVQKIGKTLLNDIKALAERYEDLIIDTGGRDSVEFRAATMVSNIVVTPINASAFNWWTLQTVDELIGHSRVYNPDLRAEIVLNRLPGNPALRRRKLNTAVDRLHAAKFENISTAECTLIERTAFSDNEEFGLTVFEPSPIKPTLDLQACAEISALYHEIFKEVFNV